MWIVIALLAALVALGAHRGVFSSKCFHCGEEGETTIYAGLPMRWCYRHGDDGPYAWGLGAEAAIFLGYNGWVFRYRGSYFRALPQWWRRMQPPNLED